MCRAVRPLAPTQVYDMDLTDTHWAPIEPVLPQPSGSGRRQQISLLWIINAIFYVLRTGCQWRPLTKGYPKWQIAYYRVAQR